MDDVARELGISKKTLYQYVSDKTELVKKVLELEIYKHGTDFSKVKNPMLNAIEEMIEVNKHIKKMLKEYNPSTEYDLKKYYPEMYRHFYEFRKKNMYNWILQNIKQGKEEGLYRADVNEEVIAKLYVSRLSINENELFTLHEFTTPKFYHENFIYHIRGIANERGLKVLEENMTRLTEE
jgi:AcrR family transcriptional regulator